jgi:small-conductance mechanosensitive channel
MTDFFEFIQTFLDPATIPGAISYALLFLGLALLGSYLSHLFMRRNSKRLHDTMAINFVVQLLQVGVFLTAVILYAQLVPALRSLGTALLAGVSVLSVILGLAAQSTLGNLIAGISLLLYRPFHIGDRVQVSTQKETLTGTVDSLTLGYTILRDSDDAQIIVPNSVMISVILVREPAKTEG